MCPVCSKDLYRLLYLHSKFAVAKDIVRDIDLVFQSQIFKMLISSTVTARTKMRDTAFKLFDTCRWVAPLRKLLFHYVDLHFLWSNVPTIATLFVQMYRNLDGVRRRVVEKEITSISSGMLFPLVELMTLHSISLILSLAETYTWRNVIFCLN